MTGRSGWMTVKNEMPVGFSNEGFFTEGYVLESKLSRLDGENGDQMVTLIEYRERIDSLMQQLLRELNNVKEDIEEHDLASEAVYRYIESYVKIFRQEKIDEPIKEYQGKSTGGLGGSGGIQSHDIARIKGNMERLLSTLLDSIGDANTRFKEKQVYGEFGDIDDSLMYMSILAKSFESSISYHGTIDTDSEGEVTELIDGTVDAEDEDDAASVLENFSEDMEDVDSAIEEVEEELEEL